MGRCGLCLRESSDLSHSIGCLSQGGQRLTAAPGGEFTVQSVSIASRIQKRARHSSQTMQIGPKVAIIAVMLHGLWYENVYAIE